MNKLQYEITNFYNMVFPSQSSDPRYIQLAKLFNYNPGDRVGDFGCGGSLFKEFFTILENQGVFTYNIDISHKVLTAISGNRICTNIQSSGLKSKSFGKIFIIGVLHHLPDMQSALREIGRVLKDDGDIIVGVYRKWSYPAFLKKSYDSFRSNQAKTLVRAITFFSIKIKLMLHGPLRNEEKAIGKRVRDLLDTPLVRYLSKKNYIELFAQSGFVVNHHETISSMNIFFCRKTHES